jgi:hypothetical protein
VPSSTVGAVGSGVGKVEHMSCYFRIKEAHGPSKNVFLCTYQLARHEMKLKSLSFGFGSCVFLQSDPT